MHNWVPLHKGTRSTGRADLVAAHLKLFKLLSNDKANDVWYMVIERLFNSSNFFQEVKIEEYRMAFWTAVKKNNPDLVSNFLTEAPHLLKQTDEHGWSAIHLCAAQGNAKIMETLIKHGVNIELKTKHSHTPIMIAAEYSNMECLKLLLRHNMDIAISRGETFDFGPLFNILVPDQGYLHSAYQTGELKLSFEVDQLVILAGAEKVCELII